MGPRKHAVAGAGRSLGQDLWAAFVPGFLKWFPPRGSQRQRGGGEVTGCEVGLWLIQDIEWSRKKEEVKI